MNGVIKERQGIRVDSAGVFLLGAVFLFLSIGLVMMGGSLYRHIMEVSNENDEARTTFSYISNQVHRADASGGVSVGELGGQPALLLEQHFGDWEFITYLYYYDGALRELFVEKGTELEKDAGLAIVWLSDLGFEQDESGLITAWAVLTNGRREQILISPRTMAEGVG
ncbi:MAG: DUF4860 domain-containing protein [Clostridiales bacterium]|nr:DUF4860 domain-containing protein [Clostridiales bacterium]